MRDKVIKTATLALSSVIETRIKEVSLPDSFNGADEECVALAVSMVQKGSSDKEHNHVRSVFNILNGNNDSKVYSIKHLINDEFINYPTDAVDDDPNLYKAAINEIGNTLSRMKDSDVWVSDYLETLENVASYIPGIHCDEDVSLYDQAKLCAALASCLCIVRDDRGSMSGEDDEVFLMYSMDFSGIQDFIYTIISEGALKTLRAKSFYLEILMENIIDDLLTELQMTRANLIYSGGGHCYLLLPNTAGVIDALETYNKKINDWLLDNYDIALYVAHGYCKCSNNNLNNIPEGKYSEIFRNISRSISAQKSHRYSWEQITKLNSKKFNDSTRECKVCKRVDRLNSDNECYICSAIKNFSKNILYDDSFDIVEGESGLPLPFGRCLLPSDSSIVNRNVVRSYHKRREGVPDSDSTPLFVGDYASKNTTLEEMADASYKHGRIKRIGVIRADVDNLGSTFSMGFAEANGGSLARTATLSRQLSLFFKHHINTILKKKERDATICYSGGDDLFIVGEWFDVIGLASDIRKSFDQYTQGTLSISAGIGIYDSSYPIKRIAYETAEMEELSKGLPGKNAITIFEDNTYKWDDFENVVLGEKYKAISEFFDGNEERGMNFLYNLLELIRARDKRVNFARYVYLLSRMEPSPKASPEKKEQYRLFSEQMYKWIGTDNDSKQLCTAIMLYIYSVRNKEENNNGISE